MVGAVYTIYRYRTLRKELELDNITYSMMKITDSSYYCPGYINIIKNAGRIKSIKKLLTIADYTFDKKRKSVSRTKVLSNKMTFDDTTTECIYNSCQRKMLVEPTTTVEQVDDITYVTNTYFGPLYIVQHNAIRSLSNDPRIAFDISDLSVYSGIGVIDILIGLIVAMSLSYCILSCV